ncbi:MAG TPA: hypothetical protein VIG51_00430 [Candidatus Baltobacteraceae bacterium]
MLPPTFSAGPSVDAASAATEGITRVYSRNATLKEYTFDARVSIVMHRFPWLRFHLDGHGKYERDGSYRIQFESVPFWAKGFDHFDMTSLDPRSWPKQYAISETQHSGDSLLVTMHERRKSNLKNVAATIDADGVRRIVWSYDSGGYVQLNVTPSSSAFILPAAEDAQIAVPVMNATAHAEFSNYHVVTDEGPVAQSAR